MPDRTDKIRGWRGADEIGAIVNFKPQRSRPNLQKVIAEPDQPTCQPAFNLDSQVEYGLRAPRRLITGSMRKVPSIRSPEFEFDTGQGQ